MDINNILIKLKSLERFTVNDEIDDFEVDTDGKWISVNHLNDIIKRIEGAE